MWIPAFDIHSNFTYIKNCFDIILHAILCFDILIWLAMFATVVIVFQYFHIVLLDFIVDEGLFKGVPCDDE